MTGSELKDITEWDTVNWGKAIKYIEKLCLPIKECQVLEIGSRNGGMSLFFANRGGRCLCTDIKEPGNKAKDKHRKYNVSDRIEYKTLDATQIPNNYENMFEIVTFKSVLGGIGSYDNIVNEQMVVEGIKHVLKKNGYVVFIENMQSTRMHRYLRRRFKNNAIYWHYQTDANIMGLFKDFVLVKKSYFGFFGLFGPNEILRRILGYIDYLFELFLPDSYKYVGVYVFQYLKGN